MNTVEYTPRDVELMKMAIEQGRKCTSVDTAYNVGAVIVDSKGKVISTGYSRQFPGNTHAEQCALMTLEEKFGENLDKVLENATMYTTMEPCSKRLSGNVPCVQRILNTKIKKVVVGVMEPPNFVQCTGTEELLNHSVDIVHVTELENECKDLNKHLSN
ncbi:hypothetical protein J3B02_000224 [Coemansia erecta]|uniref:CMP/dCMP-type deaminase domain-containing protein n=1 Tax=Coemansia asiatica TaxID=1052880 RepID=A0A9W8CJ72_9FUNG|nr:hypothetical protein LPJ64_003820 [Coemansia asiatica]KAJ2858474.1 hypothetical protein J3B02_000224 [Coemansia erecta]KAJ2880261.1 hypothetical protein FB639_002876 [Coemansia asiatica]